MSVASAVFVTAPGIEKPTEDQIIDHRRRWGFGTLSTTLMLPVNGAGGGGGGSLPVEGPWEVAAFEGSLPHSAFNFSFHRRNHYSRHRPRHLTDWRASSNVCPCWRRGGQM